MPELRIPALTLDDLECLKGFVKRVVEEAHADGVVIGLSGGIDSAVVTKLCVDALGPEKVLNVFMPSRGTPVGDYKVTKDLSEMWGTEYRVIDVQPAVDALVALLLTGAETPLERGNISARCRMIVLYNLAKKRKYLVMGTSNQSEIMMGYFTKFGDGACDVTPLANMYKSTVRQLAGMIGVPQEIIDRPPSAGLWEGQTDESDMGIKYSDLDVILFGMERDMKDAQISADTGVPKEKVSEIRAQVDAMEHKRLPAIRPGGV